MIIQRLHIKGFRNFADTWFDFTDKALIIGKNDVGKSNLLYALRILFDKKLSTSDLELTDSDFNVYTNSDLIEITCYFENVVEDCIVGENSFKGKISKDNKLVLRYVKEKYEDDFMFLAGQSDDKLEEIGGRNYIKRLYMHYVDSQRDLFSFYKTEKKKLLQASIDKLTEEDVQSDEESKNALKADLITLNDKVNNLKYISNALTDVNRILKLISSTYGDTQIKFTSVEQDVNKMLENIDLTSFTDTGDVSMGGDGRNNQIFFATWLAQRKMEKDDSCVVFYAIEEPESHLHAHQQRILADYFMNFDQGQIFITTHSPQISTRINPYYLVKLTEIDGNVVSTCGVNFGIKEIFDSFNYRLNPISSEIFYADGVLLVEGESEAIFYKEFSSELNHNLDACNCSILNVGGVGFKPYIKLCKLLNIPFVIKTDNDVFSYKDGNNRFVGLERAYGILEQVSDSEDSKELIKLFEDNKGLLTWNCDEKCPEDVLSIAAAFKEKIEKYNIFLSDKDLETDLADSEILEELKAYYSVETKEETIKLMQKRKAENMFLFINSIKGKGILKSINSKSVLKPLEALLVTMPFDNSKKDD